MTIQDLAALGELIGSVAVLATLVYLTPTPAVLRAGGKE